MGFAKVTRDLTERREADQRLEDSERRAREEAERQRRRSAALESVGRAIVAQLDLDEILQTAIDAATDLTGAEFGIFDRVHRCDRRSRRRRRSTRPRPPDSTCPRGCAATWRVPIIMADGVAAGGLIFGHPEPGFFDAEAEAAAASIASSAAVAIANARLLEAARREAAAREAALRQRDQVAVALQQSLLPPDLPAIPGLELGAHYHAGTELVGGDFYDVFAIGPDTWGVVLGDVCGSGPEAASQTALTRHTVRTAAMFDADPATVLHTLNRRAAALRVRRASPRQRSCACSRLTTARPSTSASLQRGIRRRSSAVTTAASRRHRLPARCWA